MLPQNVLIEQLHHALVGAAEVSSQVIELYHFLPMQTVLVACYSRLHAVTIAYIDEIDLTLEPMPTPSGTDHVGDDLGQALSREIPVPDVPPRNATLPPSPIATKTAKSKRKDTMDDIFGV